MQPNRKTTRGKKVAGSPGVLKVGDRELFVRTPTPADMYTLRDWVRRVWKERVNKDGGDVPSLTSKDLEGLSPADRIEVLRAYGAARADGRKISEAEATDIIMTPDGLAWCILVSARPLHDGLTYEWVRAQITPENYADLYDTYNDQTAGEDPETGEADPKQQPSGTT